MLNPLTMKDPIKNRIFLPPKMFKALLAHFTKDLSCNRFYFLEWEVVEDPWLQEGTIYGDKKFIKALEEEMNDR